MKIEITSEAGLVDPGTDEVAPVEPYAGAEADFLLSVGPDSAIGQDFQDEREERLRQVTEFDVVQWLKNWFAPEYHNVVDEVDQRIELTAYWLAVPHVPGAKSELSFSTEHTSSRSLSFTIAGIGGGPKFTATVKDAFGYTATRSERVSCATTGRVQIIEVVKQGKTIGRYPRLVRLDGRSRSWQPVAFTTVPSGTVKGTVDYGLTDATEPGSAQFTIKEGVEVKGSFGLKLESAGIDISTEMTIGYAREATIKTTLPPGHHYTATEYSGVQAYFWQP